MRRSFRAAVGVGLLVLGQQAAARQPRGSELERRCETVTAFEYEPTPKELNEALARVGSGGRTRLDMRLTWIPLAAPDDSNDPQSGPPAMLPLPRWRKPVDAARAIAVSKTMAGVKELMLDRFELTPEAARVLAGSKHLGALESLSLSFAGVTGPALRDLLAPGALPVLAELDLTNNRLTAADLQELTVRLASRKLRRLSIGGRDEALPDVPVVRLPHDATAIEALARVAATPSLTELDLNDERVGFAELQALVRVARKEPLEIKIEAFPRLTAKQQATLAALDPEGRVTFAISDLGSKPGALRALDQSGLLAKVTALEVSCGDACARILAGSAHASRLRKLVLGCEKNVPFTKATASALSGAINLTALRELALYNEVELCKASGIGMAGLRALLAAPFAGQLGSLSLDDQNLGKAGYIVLAGATTLTALTRLSLVDEEPILTAAGARLLFRDGPLAGHLEVLEIENESSAGWPLAELAKGLKMPKLRALKLPQTGGKLPEWLKVARAPGWQHVRVLAIYPQIEDEQPPDSFVKELRSHMARDACVFEH